jgi:hypothetical protein
MFFSIQQIEHSVRNLGGLHPFFGFTFLALKQWGLSVGKTDEITVSAVLEQFMQKCYRPSQDYDGFYNPFNLANHWPALRYPSTSLQRITADTFGDAFLHRKNTSEWGWRSDYVGKLAKHLGSRRLPSFDFAVWLYRETRWKETTTREGIIERFHQEFKTTGEERKALFDERIEPINGDWKSAAVITGEELLDMIGPLPGSAPLPGALLKHLEVKFVGPAREFSYRPAERLNIITGDNSLGCLGSP